MPEWFTFLSKFSWTCHDGDEKTLMKALPQWPSGMMAHTTGAATQAHWHRVLSLFEIFYAWHRGEVIFSISPILICSLDVQRNWITWHLLITWYQTNIWCLVTTMSNVIHSWWTLHNFLYTQTHTRTHTHLIDEQFMMTIRNDRAICSHYFEVAKQKCFLCFILVCVEHNVW